MYALGIDIGTTRTKAAIAPIDAGSGSPVVALKLSAVEAWAPTVAYIEDDGTVVVGEAAQWRSRSQPQRALYEFLHRIGDSVPFFIGTQAILPEEIYALIARWVRDKAIEQMRSAPTEIAMTHPADWGEHRVGVVREALRAEGLAGVRLLSEPVAAASERAGEREGRVAVCDLGGSRFSMTALTRSGEDFRVAGRPSIIDFGGRDLDDVVLRVVRNHLAPALDELDSNEPHTVESMHRLRRDCLDAKETLAREPEAWVQALFTGWAARVPLQRASLDAAFLSEARPVLARLISGVSDESLLALPIIVVGGSGSLPCLQNELSTELGREVTVSEDPQHTISRGAAQFARQIAATSGAAGDAPVPVVPEPNLESPPLRVDLPPRHMAARVVLLSALVATLVALATPIGPSASENPGGGPGSSSPPEENSSESGQ